MKTTEFMDKQIMDLSRSHSDDFYQLSYPQQFDDDDKDDEDFVSSFQFHPGRRVVSQEPRISALERGSSVDFLNLAKSGSKHVDRASEDSALISVIERKMDEHFGNLLHGVEGLSARISQLETRLRRLENSVGDLKDSTEINHGKADGKLRQLENMLREVDGGMQDLRDKQEITEAQLELAKLQMLKGYQQSENQTNNVQTVSAPGVLSSTPQQSYQPHLVQGPTQQVPSLPTDDPQTLSHQNFPPAQVPTQSPVQNPQPTPQMYYSFQVQQSQPPPTAPYHLSPPAPHPSLTSQLQQLPQQHAPFNAVDPQAQFSLVHNPGETSTPSQRYPPSFHKTSNAPGMALPTQQQQYAGSIQYTHDQTASNQYPEFSPGHMQPVQHSYFDDFRSHGGSPSDNSGPNMKHSLVLPASLDRSGGSSFSKLPTAKVLPHAIPMAASVDKESSSSGTGNRVPIDNVIDKVVAMGFRRDMVRATVKKMTENGQSVDVNLVLDKLMNNGEQPQSGGFGR
ncbi:transcriptional regulator DEF1-like [Pyrus communis]|uniref:transcriptional regulator DEF1-like n=1 Tax=Pyrus communis TaxID=23211 RepID=UPI0035C0BDF2